MEGLFDGGLGELEEISNGAVILVKQLSQGWRLEELLECVEGFCPRERLGSFREVLGELLFDETIVVEHPVSLGGVLGFETGRLTVLVGVGNGLGKFGVVFDECVGVPVGGDGGQWFLNHELASLSFWM